MIMILLFMILNNSSYYEIKEIIKQDVMISQDSLIQFNYTISMKNDPRGILNLYYLSTNTLLYDSCYRRSAQEALNVLLFYCTELWINTLSTVNKDTLKEYINKSQMQLKEYPSECSSEDKYEKTIIENIKRLKLSSPENDVASILIKLFRIKAERRKAKILGNEYDEAIRLVKKNDSQGFIRLFNIACNDDISAENSEAAGEELYWLLYLKTELWVKSIAQVDLKLVKWYFTHGAMIVPNLPKGINSEDEFNKIIVEKIKKIKANNKETEVIKILLKYFEY